MTFYIHSIFNYIAKQKSKIMCNPKFKKGSYKKRFFRPSNPLIRMACTLTKDLVGTNEEKLGQFEMVVQTKEFKEKYPGLMGKDVASIVRLQLVGKC